MKKKFNLAKITSFVLLLTVTAMILVAGTYAKYSSEASGTGATVIAKWSFEVNGTEIAVKGDKPTVAFDLFKTINDTKDGNVETDVAENLIAPGTTGKFEFKLKNLSDVTTKYDIKLEVTKGANVPLQFSVDGGQNWTDVDKLSDLVATDVMGIGTDKSVTIMWQWLFEGDTDVTLGGEEVEVTANITATQVDKSDIEIDKSELKILAIGNSFSDDSMEYVYQIAENLGYENIKLGNLYIAGCTLETHLSNAQNDSASYTYRTNTDGTWHDTEYYKMSTALQSEDWDYVTFQQRSPDSGLADTYDDLNALIELVKPMSGDAKFAWNMTWAYQADSTHSGFVNYGKDQMTMYNAITNAVQTKIVPNNEIDIIIPVGTAIQNARTSYLGDTLTRDGYHLSYDIGRYIAGVEFLHGLTGIGVNNLTYKPAGVDDYVRKVAIESANNATANKYQVTQSKYTSDFDIDNYELVTLNLTKSAYYMSAPFGNGEYIYPPTLITEENNLGTTGNYVKFWATQVFTEETMPVGSIITIGSGWQYRPDGWNDDSYNTTDSRPSNVTTSKVVIDDAWWDAYTYRGFNISKTDSSDISSLTESDINNVFKIYVPKN